MHVCFTLRQARCLALHRPLGAVPVMGRHKKMAPGTRMPSPETVAPLPDPSSGSRPWRPSVESHQQQRYVYLLQHRPDVWIADMGSVVGIAAAMVVQAPAETTETDRKRLLLLCQLLDQDREVRGGLDLRRALRRVNVDNYVQTGVHGLSPKSRAAYRSHYYRFGRLLHPAEYPAPLVRVSRTVVQPAYSTEEISRLYRRRASLSDLVGESLTTMLDLGCGVGARSTEMSALTGASVRVERLGLGREIVIVDLPTKRTGQIRSVPVLDPVKGRRLLKRARSVGPDGYLLPGSRKNAVNGVQRAVRRRGVDITISAVRLRHAWIVELASRPIPARLVLQLADLGDSHTLYEVTKTLGCYGEHEAADWFSEAIA